MSHFFVFKGPTTLDRDVLLYTFSLALVCNLTDKWCYVHWKHFSLFMVYSEPNKLYVRTLSFHPSSLRENVFFFIQRDAGVVYFTNIFLFIWMQAYSTKSSYPNFRFKKNMFFCFCFVFYFIFKINFACLCENDAIFLAQKNKQKRITSSNRQLLSIFHIIRNDCDSIKISGRKCVLVNSFDSIHADVCYLTSKKKRKKRKEMHLILKQQIK